MYRRARHLLGHDEEAKDALQEVFLRIATSRHTHRNDGPLLHWIYRVTTNCCLSRLRKRRTHPTVPDPEAVSNLVSPSSDVLDRHSVLQILGQMDALTQKIVVYHYVDGMKMEEVAVMVGYSRKTVGKKLAAFRKKAQRLLGAPR